MSLTFFIYLFKDKESRLHTFKDYFIVSSVITSLVFFIPASQWQCVSFFFLFRLKPVWIKKETNKNHTGNPWSYKSRAHMQARKWGFTTEKRQTSKSLFYFFLFCFVLFDSPCLILIHFRRKQCVCTSSWPTVALWAVGVLFCKTDQMPSH